MTEEVAMAAASPTGTKASLGDGFMLDVLTSRWVLLRHEVCGQSIRFVDPARTQVISYRNAHICGPPGSSWSDRAAASPGYDASETAALIQYLATIALSREPAAYTDPACQAAARQAIDVLQASLVAAEHELRPQQ